MKIWSKQKIAATLLCVGVTSSAQAAGPVFSDVRSTDAAAIAIQKMSIKEVAKKLAILPQSPVAPEGLTVEGLVGYGRYPHQNLLGGKSEEDKKIVQWALEAARYAHHLVAVHEGEVVTAGSPQEVLNADMLKKVFGVKAHIVFEPDTNLPLVVPYELVG